MLHWKDVPRVICSKMEGWEMEALMRRNPDLQISDIQARMKEDVATTALTNRMMRFRHKSFNLSCKWYSATLPSYASLGLRVAQGQAEDQFLILMNHG